jgi:hypothetical protein
VTTATAIAVFARFVNGDEPQVDPDAKFKEMLAFNTTLAKLLQRLKRDAGAKNISQNYKGTGRQAYRRQLWVHFTSGAVIDLWLDNGYLKFGGVVMNPPPGVEARPLIKAISYEGKTPEHVYTEAAKHLKEWAAPATKA